MTSRLNPYLTFDGDARQAMEFYERVFGGDLTLHTFGSLGEMEATQADKIMHGALETPSGFTLMGADTPPGMRRSQGNSQSVCLNGDDETELRGYWDKLSVGATVAVPLEKQNWGDVYGMCTDRFGVPWMVNINVP
ncbi:MULTISPECIES: VOC family protein [unclassified Streptomyces]|uniref:VOC family protein n=1 Tax=unclassified Streptomyces TaxID=2593676 RepID=UPI001902C651|nr:VOC family protein [Streptomyces sp. HSG2]